MGHTATEHGSYLVSSLHISELSGGKASTEVHHNCTKAVFYQPPRTFSAQIGARTISAARSRLSCAIAYAADPNSDNCLAVAELGN